jgi:hypothetical protein
VNGRGSPGPQARPAPDYSSRETLADYGDHRFRLLYRDAEGLSEEQDKIVDVVMVYNGEGALMLGGTVWPNLRRFDSDLRLQPGCTRLAPDLALN